MIGCRHVDSAWRRCSTLPGSGLAPIDGKETAPPGFGKAPRFWQVLPRLLLLQLFRACHPFVPEVYLQHSHHSTELSTAVKLSLNYSHSHCSNITTQCRNLQSPSGNSTKLSSTRCISRRAAPSRRSKRSRNRTAVFPLRRE